MELFHSEVRRKSSDLCREKAGAEASQCMNAAVANFQVTGTRWVQHRSQTTTSQLTHAADESRNKNSLQKDKARPARDLPNYAGHHVLVVQTGTGGGGALTSTPVPPRPVSGNSMCARRSAASRARGCVTKTL